MTTACATDTAVTKLGFDPAANAVLTVFLGAGPALSDRFQFPFGFSDPPPLNAYIHTWVQCIKLSGRYWHVLDGY